MKLNAVLVLHMQIIRAVFSLKIYHSVPIWWKETQGAGEVPGSCTTQMGEKGFPYMVISVFESLMAN